MTAPPPRRAAVFWAFFAIYVVWGSTYLGIRVMVEAFPPFLAAGSRFLVAGAILYGWARWRGVPAPARHLWGPAFLFGSLFFLFGNGGVSWAETRIPSGLTALLAATSPLFTTVFESARSGWQAPPGRVISGVIAGLGGVALLVTPGEIIGGGHVDVLGAAAITVAAMSWAGGSVLSHAVPLHSSPALATGMKMLSGGALLVLTGLLLGEGPRLAASEFTAKAVIAWAYLIVAGSLIGFTAFTYLLRVTTPSKVATSSFVNPLVAVALGWLLLGEPITLRTVVAAGIIIGGVVMIRLRERGVGSSEGGEPGQ